MTWRFQIPSRVAELCRKARRDVRGARSGSNIGNDVCAWIGTRRLTRSSSLRDFYEAYFSSGKQARVIQVGANDGIMCDPLRRFLVHGTSQDIRAVLVEPIPFYCTKLRNLYADYPNITVLNVACGAVCGRAPLYFIEPSVADQMNGDGPPPTIGPTDRAVSMRTWLNIGLSGIDSAGTITCETWTTTSTPSYP